MKYCKDLRCNVALKAAIMQIEVGLGCFSEKLIRACDHAVAEKNPNNDS